VKPRAYPLLTDENIHLEVALELRRQGKNVVTAMGFRTKPDELDREIDAQAERATTAPRTRK
jgi:hypothetical protein